jgi:hypothetical protein
VEQSWLGQPEQRNCWTEAGILVSCALGLPKRPDYGDCQVSLDSHLCSPR